MLFVHDCHDLCCHVVYLVLVVLLSLSIVVMVFKLFCVFVLVESLPSRYKSTRC